MVRADYEVVRVSLLGISDAQMETLGECLAKGCCADPLPVEQMYCVVAQQPLRLRYRVGIIGVTKASKPRAYSLSWCKEASSIGTIVGGARSREVRSGSAGHSSPEGQFRSLTRTVGDSTHARARSPWPESPGAAATDTPDLHRTRSHSSST
mgnify:CR=1 FL=1